MGLLQDFKIILEIVLGNMYVIKDECSNIEEKFAKFIQIFIVIRSDPDPQHAMLIAEADV
jgi:hypothetical protein